MAELTKIAEIAKNYLSKSGYNVAYINYSTKIQEYLSWYRGRTDWHKYKVYTGKNYQQVERAGLNMAKIACEDKASLELNEKLKITLDDQVANDLVNKVMKNNNFGVQGNQLVELTHALGTGAFVQSMGGGKTIIDYIHGDMIFPLVYDNGIITECAFGKIGQEFGETTYTLIMHTLEKVAGGGKEYVIKTVKFNEKGTIARPRNLTKGLSKKDIDYEEIRTGTDVPLFQIIKPNIVNNYDKTSPLGMSCFGNAIDILKSIDAVFDSWRNEFILGKKRIFVKSDLRAVRINLDSNENIIEMVDPNDVLFYQLDWKENDTPIHEFNPAIRAVEHENSIDNLLKLYSKSVGLGDNYYAFVNGNVGRTATEIVSVNSALYRNVVKDEIILRDALVGLCRAIVTLSNLYDGTSFDVEQNITIDFDDSIIEDQKAKKELAMAEYNNGLIDKVEYFMAVRDMTQEQALRFVTEMEQRGMMKDLSGGFGAFTGFGG